MTLDAFFEIQKTRIGKVEHIDPRKAGFGWQDKDALRRSNAHGDSQQRRSPQIRGDYARLRLLYD